ncbi:MAG TPA: metal-sensitive transcriptional regulator [Candidatus Obscuribacterales bacterium]
MLSSESRDDVLRRLRRIQGQVGGLVKMVDEEKYCVDILMQISAVQGALEKVTQQVLREHIHTCVKEAMHSGDELSRARKLEELITVFGRHGKKRS